MPIIIVVISSLIFLFNFHLAIMELVRRITKRKKKEKNKNNSNVEEHNFNMEELRQPCDDVFELSDAVYEQIKDFVHNNLTEEQELLVDKLILDEELKKNYKVYGLCEKCKQPKDRYHWCRICNFQQNFNYL